MYTRRKQKRKRAARRPPLPSTAPPPAVFSPPRDKPLRRLNILSPPLTSNTLAQTPTTQRQRATATQTSTATSASQYLALGVDNVWDFAAFADQLEIKVNRLDAESMEFDLIGVDPSVANALRRILIAEVPTVAIEHVFVVNNTSIVQDEVLAHRLGLVPLNVDPSVLDWRGADDAPGESNTVVLKLKVACRRDARGAMVNDAGE